MEIFFAILAVLILCTAGKLVLKMIVEVVKLGFLMVLGLVGICGLVCLLAMCNNGV